MGTSADDVVTFPIVVVSVEGRFDPRDVALQLSLGYHGNGSAAFHCRGKESWVFCGALRKPSESFGKMELAVVVGRSEFVVLEPVLVISGGAIEIADLEFEMRSRGFETGSSSMVLGISSMVLEISSMVLGISSLVSGIGSLVLAPCSVGSGSSSLDLGTSSVTFGTQLVGFWNLLDRIGPKRVGIWSPPRLDRDRGRYACP